MACAEKESIETTAFEMDRVLMVRQRSGADEVVLLFHFADGPCALDLPLPPARWNKRIDSADARWGGPGAMAPAGISSPGRARLELPATSFVCYQASANP